MTAETAAAVAIAALVVAIVALLVAFWLSLRTRRLARLGAFRPETPADLQSALAREVARADGLAAQLQDVRARLPGVERQSGVAMQRLGVVRFNPFEDTGGQQSFAIALLDSRATGFVISSLHSRQATRVYLKQISQGKSDTQLSGEESEAIRRAIGGDPNETTQTQR